jgi:hypothetical protein
MKLLYLPLVAILGCGASLASLASATATARQGLPRTWKARPSRRGMSDAGLLLRSLMEKVTL